MGLAACSLSEEKMDYKATLNLPKTDFPMKTDLPKKEPGLLKLWQDLDIYRRIREKLKDKPKYMLHDGPPYANGDIHIGHVLNNTLKDIIIKYQTMQGFAASFVPGWDCNGLPVEHQLFKELIGKHHGRAILVPFPNDFPDDGACQHFVQINLLGQPAQEREWIKEGLSFA